MLDLDLKSIEALEVFKQQDTVTEIKVEAKEKNEIKQIKIDINTREKNLHSNVNRNIAVGKTNYIDLKDIKRGDIVWINLFGSIGSEQGSDEYGRPCVCIQNNIGNTHSPTIIVACITSQMTKATLPVHIDIPLSERYGLTKDSVVLLEQIRTIDKRKRILRKTGHLDDILMKKVNKALAISVGDVRQKNTLERLSAERQECIIKSFKMIDTYKVTIETMKINNVPESAIDLIEDQKFREECGLKTYCYNNRINYEEVYNNYVEIMREKEESVAL